MGILLDVCWLQFILRFLVHRHHLSNIAKDKNSDQRYENESENNNI